VDGLRLVDRRSAAVRWIAPAAFLLAVTAVVLVVRAGLRSHTPAAATRTTTTRQVFRPAPKKPKPASTAPKRWYSIQSGDTLEAVARHFGTTVTAILALNPGIQPTALVPGQRVRIK
jgi:LysM repeat protein